MRGRRWLLIALTIFRGSSLAAEDAPVVTKDTTLPPWTVPLDVDLAAEASRALGDGESAYLLSDRQLHGPSRTEFVHYAYRVLSPAGLRSHGHLSLTIDPSFQRLGLHLLRLHRSGTIIDLLPEQEVDVVDATSDLMAGTYDRRKSVNLLL